MMFCTKCGNKVPDGVKFCSKCGNPITPVATSTPTPNPAPINTAPTVKPADAPTNYAADVPTAPIAKKSEYIKTLAPKSIKTVNIARLIVSIVCIIVLLFNIFYSVTTSLFNIPIIKLSLNLVSDSTGEDVERELLSSFDELEDELDEVTDEELEEFEHEFGLDGEEFVEDIEKIVDTPSIRNFSKITTKYDEFLEETADMSVSELRIFNILIFAIIGFFAIGFLFALFGIIFRIQGLIITGHVLSLLFAIIFAGIIPSLLTFATFLALSILLSVVNRSYKKYKKSLI